ncbi:MAG: membrane protein insertion efficiency factor YidD [Candidatus Sericytochromatia bacterium]|nr:membrane protein insertion efficiency factor YidD [Candidatus Sericytochromatia bacterium]
MAAPMGRSKWVGGAIRLIRVYQFFSHRLPRVCRFHPSCSHYAADALERHGLRRGLWLAISRVARCHPFHPGGVDPVP